MPSTYSTSTGAPVSTAEERVDEMTVAELKIELSSRGVHCPSKLKKQQLRGLLLASLNLPTLSNADSQSKPKAISKKGGKRKSKLKYWKTDDPIRKLLYFDFKEANIPLDANNMGPAEIFCKCSMTAEFQGVEFDGTFIERLKSLRLQILKEEPLLQWNEYHPARQLLFDEITAGRIPLAADQMGPAEVWVNYSDTAQFKMRGMKFGDTFKRCLADMRKQISGDKSRAEEDKREVERALRNHPAPEYNHRGEPQWNGSEAKELLKKDIEQGLHLTMLPRELRETKAQHKEFALDTFRWKISQEVRTKKYLHTLKHDAEQKTAQESEKDVN